jgi:hypothetical protein
MFLHFQTAKDLSNPRLTQELLLFWVILKQLYQQSMHLEHHLQAKLF